MGSTIKIVLVDDHPLVRQGLARLIGQETDMIVSGEASDVPTALEVVRKTKPDVVVVDLSLQVGNGIDLIKGLRAQLPDTHVLVLTMHEESFHAERALRAGAHGYLTKQEASENILAAIRQVCAGEMFVSDRLSSKLLKRLVTGDPDDEEPLLSQLSDRELQVFLLIGQGRGSKEIAEQLHLSVKTIETYRGKIKQKLDLRDARDLVQYAIRWFISHGAK